LEVKSGPNPLLTGREVPGDKAATAWCRARATNLGETVLAGWPLVIGPEPDATSSAYVAAPLFTCEVRLARTDDRWVIEHVGASVDLNPYALDLMGVARDERDELVRAVEESDAVESVSTNVGRVRAILAGLAESGLDELKSLDPESLKPSVFTKGVHPVAVVMATTGSTQMTRMLLEDLDELIWNPDLVIGTPAEQFLGLKPCSNVTAFQAQPAVVPTTLSQDQAVTSAMSNTLTVVTGPPGTGKSQVIVNLVAAALANNQTVLFASKNNKAVDVVFERLEAVSAGAGAVRAGGTARRNDAATAIAQILSAPRRSVDPVGARNRWNEVARKLDGVYENLRVRARLEGEIESVRVGLEELLAGAPSETRFDIELDNLGTALDEARRAVEAFSARLWIFGRWRKHENRLKAARSALQQLCSEVGQPASTIDHILESVSTRPQRSFEPSARFSGVEQVVELIRSVQKKQVTMSSLIADLAALPPKSAVEDELHSLAAERISASRALVDARWEQSRRDDPASRTAAGELAEQLRNVARTGSGARKARGSIVPALPAIPVWGVTNLSARTNLPLTAGLFDLVVIDEASQCDVASALPLLVRAKRAVVIGDRRQLTHITSLGPGRESRIAEAAGLSEEDAIDFSYRSRSCFGMAATRVDEDPVFLDMHFRSHPAIIGFSNHFFYEDRLKFCSPYSGSTSDPAISWDDVVGPSRAGPGNKSRINEVEAETIIERLREGLPGWRGLSLSVGVVTPYRAQAEHIRKRITEVFDDDTAEQLTVATAHRFQGDERDVILFSTVIDSDMSDRQTAFAGDANLVNVALTRARRRLIVVGNMTACLASKNVLAHLARYVSRLEAGGFDSAIEQHLHEALLARGVVSETGHVVAGHRLDLAVIHPTIRLDIECDGAAFHQDEVRDAARDRVIEEQGWKVVRFSARRLGHDIDRCVDEVIELLG
jgi:very-short-patch-repair endonuclease/RecA/RadA recombinase